LETNGYEIHLRWVVINTLPWTSSKIKRKGNSLLHLYLHYISL
jgi:hypothetical protein